MRAPSATRTMPLELAARPLTSRRGSTGKAGPPATPSRATTMQQAPTVHRPSRSSGAGTPDPLTSALIRLSLRTRRRAEDEANHTARMEMYLADLREWPLEVALKALERWPERSEWWPTWHELLGVLGEVTAEQRPP